MKSLGFSALCYVRRVVIALLQCAESSNENKDSGASANFSKKSNVNPSKMPAATQFETQTCKVCSFCELCCFAGLFWTAGLKLFLPFTTH